MITNVVTFTVTIILTEILTEFISIFGIVHCTNEDNNIEINVMILRNWKYDK